MHVVGNVNKNLLPAGGSNAAAAIMTNPAHHVDGVKVPTWEEFYNHIATLKQRIAEGAHGVAAVCGQLEAVGALKGEAYVISGRFMDDTETALIKLNELSQRWGVRSGPAGGAEEANDIVFGSTEATEVFQNFLHQNTLTVMRLQEIFSMVQLAAMQQAKLEAEGTATQVVN